ncbi:hypothetical protein C5827_17005 [Salmonella enterica]|nr:hypothetical protein [Salmonella enterica]EDT7939559.1 hypothetical protein [Salmonella enterica subsp. enterica serovar Aba]EDX1476345.1 hypothetical protein [Salmonella enterica subsp. enterica serovar Bonariensis]EEO8062419.1 hypothetical protein [Salmonella enterica]EFU0985662.1 hypothetical protein [Salmonella enterica]
MKKSMAGQGAAGALLLAGLMMSTGAMAASGDPVQGGSGSVTINVPIVTSTCSVTMPTELNFDPINKNSIIIYPNRILAMKDFNITLSNCSGKTINMIAARHDLNLTDVTGRFNSGDPDNALLYSIYFLKLADITSGHAYSGEYWLMNLDAMDPVIIQPTSDNLQIPSSMKLLSSGKDISNLGTTVSGGFDYVFTYQ